MAPKEQYTTMSIRLRFLGVFAAILVLSAGIYLQYGCCCPSGPQLGNNQRQAQTIVAQNKWAERVELPGLPNFHKVSDDLYRGAQPTAEGMKQLEKLGVKTVVNLRSVHSDSDELDGTGLAYEHIKMTAWKTEDKDVVRFLQIVTDSSKTPVFVHCQHGADRTGMVSAVYRIIVQGWSKDEAIKEMTKGGFGFHCIWQNLPKYIRKLDVDSMKRNATLSK